MYKFMSYSHNYKLQQPIFYAKSLAMTMERIILYNDSEEWFAKMGILYLSEQKITIKLIQYNMLII